MIEAQPGSLSNISQRGARLTVNWPVSLSNPTCVTCTGFSGADILTLLGEPNTLFMKVEKPPFFFHGAKFLASSEYLFDDELVSERVGVSSLERSSTEKLADCLRLGLIIRVSGLVLEEGGGPGRRSEFWYPEALVESSAPVPLDGFKGPLANSSELLPFRDWRAE